MMVSVVFDASDESVLDMDNLIGLVGYTAFVGYHHDGHSLFLVQFLQQVHHFHARFGVEGSGRLIGKDDFGFGDEGTGDGYTLLLSSRHLVGLETLTGIFGIGQAPKGSADPFALRRAALGALRIIVEKNLPLDLEDLVKKSAALFGDKLTNQNVVADVVDFMLGRFRAWYQDEGIAVDVIQAVLARRPTRPADFDARVRAVSHFRTLDSAEALAAANKRVSNILAKADVAIGEINLTACVEPAEKALAEAVLALRTEVQPLIAQGDYTAVLDKLANLRTPVDNFFDNVMVNAEDPALRQNRLAILNTLQGLFLQVADISVLQ